jgi:hypothetical protein
MDTDPSTNKFTCVHPGVDRNFKTCLLAICSRLCVVLLVTPMLVNLVLGQSKQSMKGLVVTKDGKPIAGVLVYGSVWKRCCPYQQDKVTTDGKGEFLLEHPGSVVHFTKANLQPLAFVVKPGTTQIRIIMTLAENALAVPTCVQPESNQKQLGWGKYGLHFTVPKDGVKILGGEPDVDYVRYVIKPNKGESYLDLWFGPYSISTEPDDQQFVESVDFSQRSLASVKGGIIGMDSWGRLSSGLSWRHTAAFGSGAVYRSADKESAALFDQIINSICTVDYPQK